jgi:16S rRNA (cytosine967-C5)-methyltransferase
MPDGPQNDPRLAAAEILSRWRDLFDPPMIPAHNSLFWNRLSSRDRALAFDLLHGVIRRRGTLDAIIQSVSNTPLEKMQPAVHAILHLGAYQLLMQDGGADHASIDTSVKLAQRMGATQAGGFINAILRNIQRLRVGIQTGTELSSQAFPLDSQRQVRLAKNIFPDPVKDLPRHLALVTSHPEELVQMLLSAWGKEKALAVLIADNARPLITLRTDDPKFMPPAESGLLPHQQTGWFVAAEGWTTQVEELIRNGVLSPQDPTAGHAVEQLVQMLPADDKSNPKILDLCAGLGTKTVQLAQRLPNARILAFEIIEQKRQLLSQRVTELGLKNVEIVSEEQMKSGEYQRTFDAVLADVPCSNTGVLARRVQARWRWLQLNRQQLVQTQLQILAQAAQLTRPEGILVYSTCSIDPAENQNLVHTFLEGSAASDWRILNQETILPVAGEDPMQRRDGGYVGVLCSKTAV